MDKKLSFNEIKDIINRLMRKYEENASAHGEKFFDKKGFEERYLQALKTGMDLQAFAFSEVAFLEELEKKLEKKQEKQKIKQEKPFTKKVEKYIEEMEKKWQKYPPLFTESELSDEAQFFCGALQNFYNSFWIYFSKLMGRQNITELREYNSLTQALQDFFLSSSNKLPYEVDNYTINLVRYGVEKTHMLFLKQGALLLKSIKKFLKILNQLIEKDRITDNKDVESVLANDSINKAQNMVEGIINDFRFHHIIG